MQTTRGIMSSQSCLTNSYVHPLTLSLFVGNKTIFAYQSLYLTLPFPYSLSCERSQVRRAQQVLSDLLENHARFPRNSFSHGPRKREFDRDSANSEGERGREGCVVLFLIEIDCQVTAQEGGGGSGAEAESGTSGGCSSNPSALGALLISIARTPRKLHLIRRTPKYCQTQTHTNYSTHTHRQAHTDTLRARQVAGKSARICEIHKILQGSTLILFACFLKWQPLAARQSHKYE